jgi:hypothetical protein
MPGALLDVVRIGQIHAFDITIPSTPAHVSREAALIAKKHLRRSVICPLFPKAMSACASKLVRGVCGGDKTSRSFLGDKQTESTERQMSLVFSKIFHRLIEIFAVRGI